MISSQQYKYTVEPVSNSFKMDWKGLWHYRELFYFFIWRNLKIKYKQTALGALWALIIPFTQMVIFTIIFGRIAKLPTDGLKPEFFYYSSLLLWSYFSKSVIGSSNSLVHNRHFLTKIYFPRLILPISPILTHLFDFAIASTLLIAMMVFHGITVDYTMLFIPITMILIIGTAIGTGLFLSSLNVKYRDVESIVPFLMQIWMYISVILPFSSLPENWGNYRFIYGLNPISGAIEGFRWCIFHKEMIIKKVINGQVSQIQIEFPYILILISSISMLIILISGLMYFKKMEGTFSDIV